MLGFGRDDGDFVRASFPDMPRCCNAGYAISNDYDVFHSENYLNGFLNYVVTLTNEGIKKILE